MYAIVLLMTCRLSQERGHTLVDSSRETLHLNGTVAETNKYNNCILLLNQVTCVTICVLSLAQEKWSLIIERR